MITRAHITRRAAQDNVPAKTVERDYVLAHVVAGIAALENDIGLVFKGGTAFGSATLMITATQRIWTSPWSRVLWKTVTKR